MLYFQERVKLDPLPAPRI